MTRPQASRTCRTPMPRSHPETPNNALKRLARTPTVEVAWTVMLGQFCETGRGDLSLRNFGATPLRSCPYVARGIQHRGDSPFAAITNLFQKRHRHPTAEIIPNTERQNVRYGLPKADERGRNWTVRYVPIESDAPQQTASLFDQLVGVGEQ